MKDINIKPVHLIYQTKRFDTQWSIELAVKNGNMNLLLRLNFISVQYKNIL